MTLREKYELFKMLKWALNTMTEYHDDLSMPRNEAAKLFYAAYDEVAEEQGYYFI